MPVLVKLITQIGGPNDYPDGPNFRVLIVIVIVFIIFGAQLTSRWRVIVFIIFGAHLSSRWRVIFQLCSRHTETDLQMEGMTALSTQAQTVLLSMP